MFRPLATVAARAAALSALAGAVAAGACARAATPFDPEARVERQLLARAHVDALARRIGSRATGTPENRQAREYVAKALRDAGFTVRLQEADASDPIGGLTAHVVNIIATKEGPTRDAVALISHYDSVPDGPGASDDALGVATCLVSGRALAGLGLRHSLFIVVTDGEEVGLMGARAAVADAEIAARVRMFLNFDGTGAAGPTLLFETGPGWGPPLSAWASGATSPAGASFGAEIYKRLPNDTDFTVFKTIGASGLNFAPVADSYAYHTDRDIAPRVDASTLDHEIANTIATVRTLDGMEWTRPVDPPTYFDLFGWSAIVYSDAAGRALFWCALAIAVVTWILLTVSFLRERGVVALILTVMWTLATSVMSVGLSIIGARLLRSLRVELNPWYASPHWFFLFVIALGLLGAWNVQFLGRHLPERWQPIRSPAAVWWTTLPVWAAIAVLLHQAAPAAAYLAVWPLGVAATLVLVCRHSSLGMLVASAGVLVVALALWARNTWILLNFMVPLFGWLPVTAPVWLYPVLIAVAGLFVMPGAIAIGWGRFSGVVLARQAELPLLAAVLVTGVFAWASPAYTPLRPQMRTVWYVQDNVANRAWWEVGGSEPSAGLGVPGPVGASWQRPDDALPTTVRIGRIEAPFTFRTSATPLLTAVPADVTTQTARTADGRTSLEVTIVPHMTVAFRLSLPPGVRPATSSLAGTVTRDVWHATYVALPAAGVIVRLTFDGRSPADLRGTTVLFVTAGVPSDTPGNWPAWLPRERDAWHARTMVIESVGVGG